jgi:hypothetical protein
MPAPPERRIDKRPRRLRPGPTQQGVDGFIQQDGGVLKGA